jgi:hypothetical protein
MPEVRHSVCALDCPDCCSLLIECRTWPSGKGSRLRGNPAASGDARIPVRQGGAVPGSRVLAGPAALPPETRRRERRGQIRADFWDEALDTIAGAVAQKFADEYGPEAILPYSYAGTMGF